MLDTQPLIWATAEPAKLSRAPTEAIRKSQEGGVAIAAITLWELAWLATHHRLQISGTVEAYLEEITARVAIRPCCYLRCDLVTKDAEIRRSRQIEAIW